MKKLLIYITTLLGFTFGFFGMLLYLSISWGFVLFKFWNWFIIPTFNSVQPINPKQAIALVLFLNILKYFINDYEHKNIETPNDNDNTIQVYYTTIIPWIVLVSSYVIYKLIPVLPF